MRWPAWAAHYCTHRTTVSFLLPKQHEAQSFRLVLLTFVSRIFVAPSSMFFACEDCVGPVAELTTTLTDYGIFVEASFLAYWTYRSYADGLAQGKTSERCSKFSVS